MYLSSHTGFLKAPILMGNDFEQVRALERGQLRDLVRAGLGIDEEIEPSPKSLKSNHP